MADDRRSSRAATQMKETRMDLFSEDNSTQVVQQRNSACKDPRTRRILDVITAHLHAMVRELEPTRAEWEQAIAFLTRTGQMCSDKRQEFILLSDTLGVSMLVDAINHRREGGGTESTVLGPFYVPGAQRMPLGASISKDGKGEPMLVSGRVLDRAGRPIAGATLDVWQAAPNGFYDTQDPQQPAFNLRGVFATGADGRYRFTTVKPSSYPIPDDGPVGDMLKGAGRHPYRPAHIHFIVTAPGFRPIVTHLFMAGDRYLDSDAVFGVKESLVVTPSRIDDAERARAAGVATPFWEIAFDFVLAGN
jgi:protocatechuate 3,4-dioxygenase beta subunit